jgi:UDP-N-acetylmuramyl tripeptide synthase
MKHPTTEPPLGGETAPPAATTSSSAAAPESAARGRRRLWSGQRPRAALAIVAGRSAGALARRLRLGGGTSLPGLVARWLDPQVLAYLGAQLRHGSVAITGTNGKTTTSGFAAVVLRRAGLRVWRNREGANLLRGVAAALIIRGKPTGHLRRGGDAAAVFEVDEAAFPAVVAELRPRVIAVTNLFRDQLDRYGEVDTVAEHWRRAISTLAPGAQLVLNADDPAVASLAGSDTAHTTVYFGVEEAPRDDTDVPDGAARTAVDVVDTRTCPRCRAGLVFSRRFYSHLGHWSCPACGYARPQPDVQARAVESEGLDGVRFVLVTPVGERAVRLSLPGLYNVYNALAAAAVGVAMGVELTQIREGLERFTPAFGRAERIAAASRDVRLLLAKNPTGINEVLRALGAVREPLHLLLALNDRAADGEDVSWIWDADFERVAAMPVAALTVGGTRAYDLALRLKYAGIAGVGIEPELAPALTLALERTPVGGTLYVIPTYTAMLSVRGELERRGYAAPYWEQQDA